MQIKVKLFATLEQRLPPGSSNHTMTMEVPAGTTARRVIDLLRIERQLAHLVLVNGRHLSREEVDRLALQEGETLAIFPPVAGG